MKVLRCDVTLVLLLLALIFPADAKIGKSSSKSSKPNGTINNVIILISDGCDEAIQTVARWYKGSDLQLDGLASTSVKNHMANSVITDSAAAATAVACGQKTTGSFLSVGPRTEDLLSIYNPGDMAEPYAPIASVLEAAKYVNKSTGLVATSTVSHATPAAFGSHIDNRGDEEAIMEQLVYNNIVVVLGGGKELLLPAPHFTNTTTGGNRSDCQNLSLVLQERGYQVVDNRQDFLAIETGKIWGLFQPKNLSPEVDRPETEPSLSEMTRKAIELLSQNKEGFLIVVEGSQIDLAAHNNDPIYMVRDFIAFDDAVRVAIDFAKLNKETLVLAFSDHSTGGLKIGNYLHGYVDVTVEALVDPLLNMTMTANRLVSMLPNSPSSQQIITALKYYWGMDITEDDVDAILEYSAESGQNLSYAIARILTERYTYLAFSTRGHNGETVPLWMYGKDAPQHVIDNTEIATMVADALKVDLEKLTDDLFLDLDSTQLDYQIDLSNDGDRIVRVGDAIIPVGKDLMRWNGEEIRLPGLTIYAPKTNKVYLSREAVRLLG